MDKDKRIEELEKENQQLHKRLKNCLKLLSFSMPVFWKKTEKLDKNQLSFFSEAELKELDIDSDISSKENEEVEVELRVVRHRKVKPRGQRAEFLDTLVQVDVVHDLEQKIVLIVMKNSL
ncbi:hypothetical protein O2U01_10130 (plasmid) [Ligilactobacillus salivarius]|uniref:IS66 family transposase n=1 Tax=Ligilactobacillus salivarius TaxID=1624 RepID=UPI0024BA8732|nr:hypothetical protein [Ligilactobacillus salivarius]WHS21433.1 hypothetical protein O2U01_10130 [Ligilactobacillus salivarius]